MRRLLVTGGAGFIGTNFVYHWIQRYPGDQVIVLDKLTYAGRRENLTPLEQNKKFTFVQGDVRDSSLVRTLFQKFQITHVVHFAAESHVDRSIHQSRLFVETNVLGTHTLLEAARETWNSHLSQDTPPVRFHHISTDEVFGSLKIEDPPFHEASPYAPNSPYSASKAAADHLVRAYHVTYGLPVTLSYCSNNYGPYQFPEKLIPLALSRIMNGDKIPIYGTGENRREWLYVKDHCVAVEKILCKGRVGETYCIGGGEELSNLDLIRQLCALTDIILQKNPSLQASYPHALAWQGSPSESLIVFVQDRPGHDLRYAIDASKIRGTLNWTRETDFDKGLSETLLWYLTEVDASYFTFSQRSIDQEVKVS